MPILGELLLEMVKENEQTRKASLEYQLRQRAQNEVHVREMFEHFGVVISPTRYDNLSLESHSILSEVFFCLVVFLIIIVIRTGWGSRFT